MKIFATVLAAALTSLIIGSGVAKADDCYFECNDDGSSCTTDCY